MDQPGSIEERISRLQDDVESIGAWVDFRDFVETIDGIERGRESIARGEGRPAAEVFAELRAKYGIPAPSQVQTPLVVDSERASA